ncbi:flavodoxin family protein [Desulfolithobacter sp.]
MTDPNPPALLFLGSPRRNGNTETLLRHVGKGIEEAGGTWELIRLPELDIHPCHGCGNCEKKGTCILNDTMSSLYPRIMVTDRIVIGSPIYFYGLTAQAKLFIDRCQALWSRKYIFNKRRNNPNAQGYLVSTAASRGDRLFDGAILTARYGFDAMDLGYGGELLARGLEHRESARTKPDLLDQAVSFGRQIQSSRDQETKKDNKAS